MPRRKTKPFAFKLPVVTDLPPDPEEMNDERSQAALSAIESFAMTSGEALDDDGMLEQNISDFLADLGHLCDRAGIMLEDMLNRARTHYRDETDGKGVQL